MDFHIVFKYSTASSGDKNLIVSWKTPHFILLNISYISYNIKLCFVMYKTK